MTPKTIIILAITKKKMKRERPIDPLTRHSSISGGEYEFNRRPIISVVGTRLTQEFSPVLGPRRIIVGSLGWPAALEITIAEIVAGHRLQSMPSKRYGASTRGASAVSMSFYTREPTSF